MKNTRLLLVILSLLLLGASLWLFNSKKKSRAQIDMFERELYYLRLKTEADELFINRDYTQAEKRYQFLDSAFGDSLWATRSTLQEKSKMPSRPIVDAQQKIEQLTRELAHLRNANSTTFVDTLQDNSSQTLNDEITKLKDQIRQLQQSTHPTKGVIKFKNLKNGTITFFGDLSNNMANGIGFGYWTSGSTYEGAWKDNSRHGQGTFIWADGEKYVGDYVNDKRDGYGVYTAKAGRYEGQWKNDMRDGEGNLYEPNGKLKVHGIWQNDKLMKTLK